MRANNEELRYRYCNKCIICKLMDELMRTYCKALLLLNSSTLNSAGNVFMINQIRTGVCLPFLLWSAHLPRIPAASAPPAACSSPPRCEAPSVRL